MSTGRARCCASIRGRSAMHSTCGAVRNSSSTTARWPTCTTATCSKVKTSARAMSRRTTTSASTSVRTSISSPHPPRRSAWISTARGASSARRPPRRPTCGPASTPRVPISIRCATRTGRSPTTNRDTRCTTPWSISISAVSNGIRAWTSTPRSRSTRNSIS